MQDRAFDTVYIVAFSLYIIVCICRCRMRHCRHRRDILAEQAAAGGDSSSPQMTPDERRAYIQEKLIIKKAASEQDFSIHNIRDEEIGNAEESKIDLSGDKDTTNGEDNNMQSSSPIISIRNLASSFRNTILNGTSASDAQNDGLDSTKACPICFEEYSIGDDMCSSRNSTCSHVFHAECMTNWLMKSDNCPLCRANYLSEDTADAGDSVEDAARAPGDSGDEEAQ